MDSNGSSAQTGRAPRDPATGDERNVNDTRPDTVVFDIGNVLLEWDPRHLYRKLLPDDAAVEAFLADVCPPAWNLEQDKGRPFAEAVALQSALHPQHAALIRAFDERWEEMVPGPIEGSVALLRTLQDAGVATFSITNFSREKFDLARRRFPFLNTFSDTVVSADVGLLKPDPAIYRVLLDRNGLAAGQCIFIDDSAANVQAARDLGMEAVHFHGPDALRQTLSGYGLPV